MNPEYATSPFWLRVFCSHHEGQSQEAHPCIIHPFSALHCPAQASCAPLACPAQECPAAALAVVPVAQCHPFSVFWNWPCCAQALCGPLFSTVLQEPEGRSQAPALIECSIYSCFTLFSCSPPCSGIPRFFGPPCSRVSRSSLRARPGASAVMRFRSSCLPITDLQRRRMSFRACTNTWLCVPATASVTVQHSVSDRHYHR